MTLARANELYDAGHTREAAALYRDLWRAAPEDFGLLCKYAFAENNHSRPNIIAAISDYLRLLSADDLEGRTKALALQLPYLEAERRVTMAGVSDYSADTVDEAPFRMSPEQHAFITYAHAWLREKECASSLSFAAKAHFISGQYAQADAVLERLRAYHADLRDTEARFGGEWFDDLDDAAERFEKKLPALNVLLDVTGKLKANRVFIGCDWAYYEKHGIGLANSLKDNDVWQNPGWRTPLHVHWFTDGPDGTRANLQGMSCEKAPVQGEPARFYYAAIRLFRLWQLMERDGKTTIMLDADVFVGKPMDELFDRLEAADVALCRMPGRLHFHTQFNASVVGFTKRSLPYLRRVAGYIAKCFEANRVPWCLDQIALSCVLREMQSRGDAPKAIAVGPGVYDGTYNAMLWPQKVGPDSEWLPRWQAAQAKWGNSDGKTSAQMASV